MRTARLQTICESVAITRCHLREGPQVNKFQQVTSVTHQMSLLGLFLKNITAILFFYSRVKSKFQRQG